MFPWINRSFPPESSDVCINTPQALPLVSRLDTNANERKALLPVECTLTWTEIIAAIASTSLHEATIPLCRTATRKCTAGNIPEVVQINRAKPAKPGQTVYVSGAPDNIYI